jgi:hypothetical protein
VLLYAYFSGRKPEWLVAKVFALASFYGERTYISVIQTNLIDEIGSVFTLIGLLILFFSKVPQEDGAIHNPLRLKALVHSVWIVSFIWLLIILLVYGYAIFFVSTTIFGLFLLCCNIHFYIQLLLLRKKKSITP